MASKETSKTKSKFPRRILSSLRRNKKTSLTSLSYKNDLSFSRDDRPGLNKKDIENIEQENVTINLEATLPLDSPRKQTTGLENNHEESTNLLSPQTQTYRPINSDVSIIENVSRDLLSNFLSPNSRRVELGGGMSASTDSGIDCSILVSEKSSPEQFVAFTRREAERIRQQQQIAGFNESLLEPLNEVDSHSSSDIENENRNGAFSNTVNIAEGVTVNDSLSQEAVSVSTTETLSSSSLAENSGRLEKVARNEFEMKDKDKYSSHLLSAGGGDYVLLTDGEDQQVQGSSDQNDYVTLSANGAHFEQVSVCNTSVTSVNTEISFPQVTQSSPGCETFVDGKYINYCANKTDDSKSAEARMMQDDSIPQSVQLLISHDVVSPVPVLSTSIATQRTLSPTPNPAMLLVNENSAFARCKSLKRSVSDVGKGILGRFRHKSKDSITSASTQEDSLCGNDGLLEESVEKKEKHSTRSLKKFKKLNSKRWKERTKSKSGSKELKIGRTGESSEVCKQRKSPVFKEVVSGEERTNILSECSVRKSPVAKEILSEVDRQQICESLPRQGSPVGPESIQDFTNSICKMTSALHASSAESIACICDCKNRKVNPECCEKRKTPSPAVISLSNNICSDAERNTDSDNLFEDAGNGNELKHSQEPRSTNSSAKLNMIGIDHSASATSNLASEAPSGIHNHCDLCSDCESEDDDDDYDFEYEVYDQSVYPDDLDCSNCCIASPETGKLPLDWDDGSSDTETCSLNSFSSSSDTSESSEVVRYPQSMDLDMSGSAHSLNNLLDSDSVDGKVSSSVCLSKTISNFSSTDSTDSTPVKKNNSEEDSCCGYFLDVSPSSVSFHEVDFDNGEVMYMENSVNGGFSDPWENGDVSSKVGFSARASLCATPASSPCVKSNGANNSDSPKNISINKSWTASHSDEIHYSGSSSSEIKYSESNIEPLDIDSSFTNVSFEGSFAESSFSVRSHHEHLRNTVHSRSSNRGRSEMNRNETWSVRGNAVENGMSASFSQGCDTMSPQSQLFSGQPRQLHSASLNDSYVRRANNFERNNFRRSYSSCDNANQSFTRCSRLYSSFHESSNSPCPSPLDLSINKAKKCQGKSVLNKSFPLNEKSCKWLDKHVGQVLSPAKRVLQKNRGVSESDLCKEILNLYVSDADESGFEVLDCDSSRNLSSVSQTDLENSTVDDEGSGSDSSLKYGTYVAPRHATRETNVDDFTTTTVWTCYTGEAKTRKLQGIVLCVPFYGLKTLRALKQQI